MTPDTQWKDEMGDLQSRKIPGGVLYRTGGQMRAPGMVFVPISEIEISLSNELKKALFDKLSPLTRAGEAEH